MKCRECQKEIETEVNEIPPRWFGRYRQNGDLVEVICSDCIVDPEKKKKWSEFGEMR